MGEEGEGRGEEGRGGMLLRRGVERGRKRGRRGGVEGREEGKSENTGKCLVPQNPLISEHDDCSVRNYISRNCK